MKTVLITGASGGIGQAMAMAFAQAGYAVAVHCHSQKQAAQKLKDRVLALGQDCEVFCADLTKRGDADTLCREVLARFGRVDVLVNNAGAAEEILFSDVEEEHWDYILDCNLKSAYRMIHGLLPAFYRQQGGVILNVSSVWGQVGAACEAVYSAAKAGLIGLTKALAKEVGPSGIRVNCVAPGVIDTEMNQQLDEQALAQLREETPLGIIGSCDQVAKTILFLASQDAGFITGQVISVDGGMSI